MSNHSPTRALAGARRVGAALLCLAPALAACEGVLDVSNPNNVKQEDLANPTAATAQANGSLATVARGYGRILIVNATVSDELKWVGSRDAYRELDFGNLANPLNEFSDAAFPYVAEARWMSDEAVANLEAFDAQGALRNRADLARAYIYSAIAYLTVADHFDDFALSNRQEAAPPIGEANMARLYDDAVARLDQALAIAEGAGNVELRMTALALRARARHGKAVWMKVNPRGTVAADPLVDDPGANADAQAFLALSTVPDWFLRFTYSATTVEDDVGAWVNERLEMRVGDDYVVPTSDNKKVASIRLRDPIDGVPDPILTTLVNELILNRQYNPLRVVSAREMHLILAEAALARGSAAEFATHLNHVRALNALTPYSGQIPALDMLRHARRVNLFLQGRRLIDQYRFREASSDWLDTSDAVREPGTFFPIAYIEQLSNCHLREGGC